MPWLGPLRAPALAAPVFGFALASFPRDEVVRVQSGCNTNSVPLAGCGWSAPDRFDPRRPRKRRGPAESEDPSGSAILPAQYTQMLLSVRRRGGGKYPPVAHTAPTYCRRMQFSVLLRGGCLLASPAPSGHASMTHMPLYRCPRTAQFRRPEIQSDIAALAIPVRPTAAEPTDNACAPTTNHSCAAQCGPAADLRAQLCAASSLR